MIAAYPLQWPVGWPRTAALHRGGARFSQSVRKYGSNYRGTQPISVAEGVTRVLLELERMGINRQDVVLSTNVKTRLDGLPRSGDAEPYDPGAAAYWTTHRGETRVMAIDQYDTVAGNLGAIAATLSAMRAIERHGGAQILDRAFTGFAALPNPNGRSWRDVFGFESNERVSPDELDKRYRVLASSRHPDRGGSTAAMTELNLAKTQAAAEL